MNETTEQEFLVLLEFSDANEANYCKQFDNEFETLEIETSNPILKIGNRLYSGQYQNNVGTYMFFTHQQKNSDDTAPESSAENPKGSFQFYGKSYKKLLLNRLYVKPKEEATPISHE